ncbi:hypothetical protein [Actinomadura madurae]|uniref:hypothetical protein n=1 Tax=Actinomadura madurae TaxID=1993 RepID=UPI000D8F7CCB|nr:hypothetical protein [Actinomadura madurae]SPT59249.1 Uncharacterised protein [Actinomadura madurae]
MKTTMPAVPAPRRPLRASAIKRCPSCAAPLDGGPVLFRCDPCGRSVTAADLDIEYRPANRRPVESLGADALDSNPARIVLDGRHAG